MAALLVHDTSLAPPPPRWHRHVEGWQLGVVAVGMALVAAVLLVPRPVVPREIPLPAVDRGNERRRAEEDETRARRARSVPLPYPVRAVGEALRRYGAAEGGAGDPAATLRDLRGAVEVARREHGDEPLLDLRAVQQALFADAVARWVRSGEPDAELAELGGAFVERARVSRWVSAGRLDLAPGELRSLFVVRWSRLTGLAGVHPFLPSLDEWRAYYHIVLRSVAGASSPDVDATIAVVRALARIDPEYPGDLALGVLEYRRGNVAGAAQRFRKHLADHPGGAFRLRAQNYLVAAAHALPAEEEE